MDGGGSAEWRGRVDGKRPRHVNNIRPLALSSVFFNFCVTSPEKPLMDDAAAIAAARIGIGEVENGIASTAFLRACRDPSPPSTSIDVLEITKNEEPHTRWFQGLDHDALVRRCAESADGKATSKGPSLRILFLNITPLRGGNRIVLAHPKTLEFLRKNFSVSLLFLDCLGELSFRPEYRTLLLHFSDFRDKF